MKKKISETKNKKKKKFNIFLILNNFKLKLISLYNKINKKLLLIILLIIIFLILLFKFYSCYKSFKYDLLNQITNLRNENKELYKKLNDNLNLLNGNVDSNIKDIIVTNQLLAKENINLEGIISSLENKNTKSKIIKNPVNNKVTTQIDKRLIGKYVSKSTEENVKSSYFEIKSDGSFVIFDNYCEGFIKLTNNEMSFYAHYSENYTALTFVLKPGFKYLVGKSDLSINFHTNDNLDSKNIKFVGD
jgi:hypothetical protein